MRLNAQVIQPAGDRIESLAGKETTEHLPHIGGLRLLRNQYAVLGRVTKGGGGLQLAPAVLLLHTALDIFGQVDGIVFVHGLDHGLHDNAQLSLGDGLLNGNNLNMELLAQDGFIKHGIVTISGEAGKLPQEDGIEGLWLLLGGADEPAEVVAARDLAPGLGLIHKNEFVRNNISIGGGPFADLYQLGGRGELHLVIGGDADVGGGYAVIFRCHLWDSPLYGTTCGLENV